MKFTEWGSKRQKSWYRQMRRKERKEYQDRNIIGWDFNALFPTAWLSFQPDYLYADVDKTVAAAFGGGIASFDDLSGNGVAGPQPVSPARPIMGRVPRTGRRNVLSNNNALDVEWSPFSSQVSVQGGVTDPFGGNRAFRITVNSVGGNNVAVLTGGTIAHTLAGKPCVASVWARRVLGSSTIRVYFDEAYPPSVPLTNEWERVEIPFIGGTNGANRFDLRFTVIGSEVDIYLPQLEPGTEATEAQIASSAYDVTEAGVPPVYYARYDSADDVLPHNATLPAITDGTVILIGQQGIWIDEGYSFAGGNWSLGPATYTDGPDGIIGVVGDMLDLVVLDRPLTADERDKVVAYGVKRGSAGLIELGPEQKQNYLFPGASGRAEYISEGDYFRIERSGSLIGIVSYVIEPTPALHLAQYEWLSGSTVGARDGASVISGYEVSSVDPLRNVVLSIAPGPLRFYHGGTGAESTFRVITLRRLIMPGETP